jgi:hypothetical protein
MISRTGLASDVTVQSREDKITVREQLGLALTQNKITQLLGHGASLLPIHGILVLLVCRTLGSADCVKLKEGVVCQ